MTAHKHLKRLVRARMGKTGESYASARRSLRGNQAPESADGSPAERRLAGRVPAANVLRTLLSAAGVSDPRGKPPSEALAFGLAGGIGIGVCQFVYEKEDFASFYLAGRHHWQDDAGYLTAAAQRLGLTAEIRETSSGKAAEKHLREALATGRPCAALVDMAHLPHRGMPARFSGGGYHVVTIHELDEARGVALMSDLAPQRIEVPLADLSRARARIKKFKNRLISIEPAAAPVDLAAAARGGLRACCGGLTAKPKKGFPNTFCLEGIRVWGERLRGSGHKDDWERTFTRGHRLWQGLTSIHLFIEDYGTGGGLCRPLFAEFLSLAAALTGARELEPLAKRYARLGEDWRGLADAALPADAPLFREHRQLCARRDKLMATASADPAPVREVWAEMDALAQRAKTDFPLSEGQCAELRAELARRVQALYEAEATAHAALADAL